MNLNGTCYIVFLSKFLFLLLFSISSEKFCGCTFENWFCGCNSRIENWFCQKCNFSVTTIIDFDLFLALRDNGHSLGLSNFEFDLE